MERFTVTVFHTASWTMSIPGFFRFLPRPLISKQTRRLRISTVVRWLKKLSEPFTYRSSAWATRSASGMPCAMSASSRSPSTGIFSGRGSAKYS